MTVQQHPSRIVQSDDYRTWASAALPEAQRGMWFAQSLDPANPAFNTGECVVLRGALDRSVFELAVRTVLQEADGLSVRVVESEDGPMVESSVENVPALEIVDCRGRGEEHARAMMQDDLMTPIDLRTDRPARVVLFVIADDHHMWFVRAHHMVIDGYGMRLLFERVASLYSAAVKGANTVSRPFVSYGQVLAEASAYVGGERRAVDGVFWRSAMEDMEPVAGLAEGAPNPVSWHRAVTVPFSAIDTERLAQAAVRARVTWPDVLTGLISAWMERHTGGGVAVPGVAAMLRVGSPAARVPTMTMNVVPCPIRIDDTLSIDAFHAQVAKRLREVRKHARYRGEQIRRDLALLGTDRRLHAALINILPFGEPLAFAGLESAHEVLAPGPVDDLTVEVRGDAEGRNVQIALQANPALYDAETLNAHADRLGVFLSRALTAERLADVPTLTPAEVQRWVVEVNDTAHPVAAGTLVELMEQTVARVPNALALRDASSVLSWSAWDMRTSRLAQSLAAHGVRPGTFVALRMQRSMELVLMIGAVVRTGGAWLPLDPDDPDSRISVMLEAAKPLLVVADPSVAPRTRDHAAGVTVTTVLELENTTSAQSGNVEIQRPGPDDPAYVIFTSGSTGTPKGVVVTHRAIVNRLLWMADTYAIDENARLLLKTPVTFDVSVWELVLPATCGASLTVAEPGVHRDPVALAALMRQAHITVVHFVPSMLAAFLDEPSAHGLPVKQVFVSGEALPAGLRDRFHRTIDAELHNLYGPTEAAVDVTHWEAHRRDDSDPVPIGRPVWNTQVYVLDRALRPLPPGTVGQLHLGGAQLAREYLGRPDLTAQAFLPSPFGRIYRTGDLATWRHDGALLYGGREDSQVKLRGQRIELGEVEQVLRGGAGVRDVAVIVREDRPGDQRLVAYVVAEPDVPFQPEQLRSLVAERLPAHFVPSVFMVIDALPVSRHGKLDRGKLPTPVAAVESADVAVLDAQEVIVAGRFRQILGLPATQVLAPHSDFFLLGGHSLLAVRLVHALTSAGASLTLGTVFANPTVAALARHIGTASPTDDSRVVTERDGLGVTFAFGASVSASTGDGAPLFCIHPAGGLAWCYRPLAQSLRDVRPVIGIQSRGLQSDVALPSTLSLLAADYLRVIRTIQPHGPLHLLGWSIGGLIAHEMAVQLEHAGEAAGSVVMLDAFPADRWRTAPEADEAAALHALLLIAGIAPDDSGRDAREHQYHGDDARSRVRARLAMAHHPLAAVSEATFDGIVRSVMHNNRLVRAHRHRVLSAPVTYLRAALEHAHDEASPDEWLPYVRGGFDVVNVDARHSEMCSAAVAPAVLRALNDERFLDHRLDHHMSTGR